MRPVSGLRVPAVGGNANNDANNGGNAGLEYLNVNNGVSTANANYGSPLNFLARPVVSALPLKGPEPHPMVENKNGFECW